MLYKVLYMKKIIYDILIAYHPKWKHSCPIPYIVVIIQFLQTNKSISSMNSRKQFLLVKKIINWLCFLKYQSHKSDFILKLILVGHTRVIFSGVIHYLKIISNKYLEEIPMNYYSILSNSDHIVFEK